MPRRTAQQQRPDMTPDDTKLLLDAVNSIATSLMLINLCLGVIAGILFAKR